MTAPRRRRVSPTRPHDPVGWRQWALDDLAAATGLSLSAQRILRRMTLDAHWRDHTIEFGSRKELAARLGLGPSHGRSTVARALVELEGSECLRAAERGVYEVVVYRLLVCPRSMISVDDLDNATFMRPAVLDVVTARAGLSFLGRAMFEVLMSYAGHDSVIEASRTDLKAIGRSTPHTVQELIDAGLLEPVRQAAWQLPDYHEAVWIPGQVLEDQVVDLSAARLAGERAALQRTVTHLEGEIREAAVLVEHAISATDDATARWLRPIADRLTALVDDAGVPTNLGTSGRHDVPTSPRPDIQETPAP